MEKKMSDLVDTLSYIFLILHGKNFFPLPKEFYSKETLNSNITFHQITHLCFQLLIKISCFSSHFPTLQSNEPLNAEIAQSDGIYGFILTDLHSVQKEDCHYQITSSIQLLEMHIALSANTTVSRVLQLNLNKEQKFILKLREKMPSLKCQDRRPI